MTTLFDLNPNDLEKMPIRDYFKGIELAIINPLSVDKLTDFFTVQPYFETKPYLTRRYLKPKDCRFTQIELVYKDRNKVCAIVWDITIYLSQLTEIFGVPDIHNDFYSEETAFAFTSNNNNIEIIKTRHPKLLTIVKGKNVFEYQGNDNQKVELADPEFSFIQFSLTNQEDKLESQTRS